MVLGVSTQQQALAASSLKQLLCNGEAPWASGVAGTAGTGLGPLKKRLGMVALDLRAARVEQQLVRHEIQQLLLSYDDELQSLQGLIDAAEQQLWHDLEQQDSLLQQLSTTLSPDDQHDLHRSALASQHAAQVHLGRRDLLLQRQTCVKRLLAVAGRMLQPCLPSVDGTVQFQEQQFMAAADEVLQQGVEVHADSDSEGEDLGDSFVADGDQTEFAADDDTGAADMHPTVSHDSGAAIVIDSDTAETESQSTRSTAAPVPVATSSQIPVSPACPDDLGCVHCTCITAHVVNQILCLHHVPATVVDTIDTKLWSQYALAFCVPQQRWFMSAPNLPQLTCSLCFYLQLWVATPAMVDRYQHMQERLQEMEGKDLDTAAVQDVSNRSLLTLLPGQWLNDEVMNKMLRLFLHEKLQIAANGSVAAVHIFDTFFMEKLYLGFKLEDVKERLKLKYSLVQNQTLPRRLAAAGQQKSSILDCRWVVVPCNLPGHWVLVVADLQLQQILYLDPMYVSMYVCMCHIS